MAKLTKTTKTVLIAAAVLLVLGVVLLALVMTKPSDETSSSSDSAPSVEDTSVTITDKEAENVLSLKVKNETGEFSFGRNERVVSSADSEGNISSKTEYYFTSPEMNGLSPNDSVTSAFVRNMAGLSTKNLVEENAEDLARYGLDDPRAEVEISFDDGSTASLCFGIQNPANTGQVYFRTKDSRDVHQVSYYSVGSAFYDIRDFVSLVMTPAYSTDDPQELDYMTVERKDLDEPIEIRYMYDVAAAAEDEDTVITTFNSHRFVSPINTEVDTTAGQKVCYGLYGLTMSSCAYLDKTEETLAATGLDDPFAKVTFKYGGKRYVLSLGDAIIETLDGGDGASDGETGESPDLAAVTGYYACLDGVGGIYSISTANAPWYSFTVENIMSRRPISPYIYTVDNVEIITPDGEYVFKIEGDSDSHTFTCGGEPVDDYGFRQLYQHLITSIGEELYFEETDAEPLVTVRFNYRSDYEDVYGTSTDELIYYGSDDRKNIIRVNGKVLFKVREVYTERLIDNVRALLEGGEIELNW